MELIGHRGCGEQYPENTVHAVRQSARRLGAVEVDARRCRTGELIAFHDETVDRVTDAVGSVSELRWERLRELAVDGSEHRIALLRDVLAAVPPDVTVQVELKETGIAADAIAIREAAETDVRVTSFDPEALAEVREVDPDLPTGYLIEDDVTIDEGVETALELDCEALHPRCDRCVTSGIVERIHDAGLDVIAWDGGVSERTVEAVRAAGVDGITADRWDLGDVSPRVDEAPTPTA